MISKIQKDLPSTGFVRLSTVLQFIPVAKSTWWLWCAQGKAPKGIKLSKTVTAWKVEEIKAFIAGKGGEV
ncbi:AlpA family phage regulatory protein [Simiduia curdlanivorans]|uniref:Helix-turn-helix transcriptional regulator n=1 Tax=Simiduia curdlanivorans TaxID=1492769 RepID=A0ABV8V864_9GAMM|nr:AlpA family phage regulatory protein [Simiduia curdlanivorans]MDN3638745.1 AlpA family phage regulatory protein [Simiduia curdlanivorans]